jgi:hypothetical protein
MTTETPASCDVQRRSDGSILVRVRSAEWNGRQLPDAVFTFRHGDPQFNYWDERAQPIIDGSVTSR